MEKLKPCPFCSGEVEILRYAGGNHRDNKRRYSVWCFNCELSFGYDDDSGGKYDSELDAIAAWNTRIDTVTYVTVTNDNNVPHCSLCGAPIFMLFSMPHVVNYCYNCGAKMVNQSLHVKLPA